MATINLDRKFCFIFLIGLILVLICFKDIHCNCVLPSELQNNQWSYNAPARTTSDSIHLIQFTTGQLQGFQIVKAGITMTNYDCIKNVTLSETESILIFKSTSGYFNSITYGTDYVFLCAKVTKVSHTSFYFYLLNDIQTSTSPNERVSFHASPPTLETDQICGTYCTYDSSSTTTPVITDDIRYLTLVEFPETIPSDASLCQPCASSCETAVEACPELQPVPDSTRVPITPTHAHNETVTYNCNVGYEKTSGDLQRVCKDDGTWSGAAPVCSIKSCPALSAVAHATSSPTNPTNNYNEVVTYTCNTGYEITSGNAQRTCQDDKTWSGNPPVCGPSSLGQPSRASSVHSGFLNAIKTYIVLHGLTNVSFNWLSVELFFPFHNLIIDLINL